MICKREVRSSPNDAERDRTCCEDFSRLIRHDDDDRLKQKMTLSFQQSISLSLSGSSYLDIGAELMIDGVVVGVSQRFARLNLLCTKTSETINTVEKTAVDPTIRPMMFSSNCRRCFLWLSPHQHCVTYSSCASVECLRIRKHCRVLSFVVHRGENSWINKWNAEATDAQYARFHSHNERKHSFLRLHSVLVRDIVFSSKTRRSVCLNANDVRFLWLLDRWCSQHRHWPWARFSSMIVWDMKYIYNNHRRIAILKLNGIWFLNRALERQIRSSPSSKEVDKCDRDAQVYPFLLR